MISPFSSMMKNTLICLYFSAVLLPQDSNAQFHTLGTQSKSSNSFGTDCIMPQVRREESAPSFIKNTPIDEPSAISRPLRKLLITSPRGFRKHPIDGIHTNHNGIDLRAHFDSVFSIMDGVVVHASNDPYSGMKIKIEHHSKLTSTYAHLSLIFVKTGQEVKSGDCIGLSGKSGKIRGPHLHFSLTINN
jgi:murein DD-endopeptidase MepM/ murein hydrolase activator NlpD